MRCPLVKIKTDELSFLTIIQMVLLFNGNSHIKMKIKKKTYIFILKYVHGVVMK